MDSNIELVLHRLVDQLLSGACEFHSRLNLALIGFGFSHHSEQSSLLQPVIGGNQSKCLRKELLALCRLDCVDGTPLPCP